MMDIVTAARLLEEAVFAPDNLGEALSEAGRALGFDHFCLVHSDLHNLTSIANEESTEALELYAKGGWVDVDYRSANVGRVRDNKLFLDHLMVPEDKRIANPIFNDLYVPKRMAYYAGWRFSIEGSTWNIALARSQDRGPVTSEEAQDLERLMPVANRSLYLIHRLRETQVRGLFDGLSATHTAAVLLNRDGRVGRITPQAERLFNIDFNVKDSTLWSAHAASNARLGDLSKRARTREDGAPLAPFLVHRFSDSRPILAQPIFVRGAGLDLMSNASIVLFLTTPGQTEMIDEQNLQLLFGLSRAEAQIAHLLAEGLDPQQIAERRGVSVGTIRVQMKHIFQKANVHRQSELIKAIAEMRPPDALALLSAAPALTRFEG